MRAVPGWMASRPRPGWTATNLARRRAWPACWARLISPRARYAHGALSTGW